ncbi:glycosyltransferase family 2 protein [Winogradskyella thalassocola]|uniref:Glycosyl transferase family 2 n=1 Tax=Winogradskyella thalassocola TaxID=262004 RepID=A0A1G7Z141_9FLAO|nr:glycosyltransferase family 2 protein [Winogradskyella thalassocola]SDH02315.1 Glycosyl transferase family 2 [Winogradskyella thalassocola]
MVEPLVSIIIPLYNAEHLICQTLDSINNQTYSNWECLIIDDGSTDYSFKVASTYCLTNNRFKVFKRPNTYKSGGSGSRNYGLDISHGDFIQWFDSDDLMHPSMLEEKLKMISEDKHAVICQTIQFRDDIKNIVGEPTAIRSENKFIDFFSGKITYYTPGPLWRKSFLNDINLRFNENLLNIQEWEFYCKILLLDNINIDYINKPLIYYRKHTESIWGKERSASKILSEFYGVRSVYEMAIQQRKEIVQVYFQRQCRLLVELRKADPSNANISEVKHEVFQSFFSMSFNIKNFLKFVKYYYLNL